ncbi:MAG TPA: glycosyltransferase [Pyrinomonadaceae bacterium]|nr:glycosyltransferase [Pyrinomonadaceae bacterium]
MWTLVGGDFSAEYGGITQQGKREMHARLTVLLPIHNGMPFLKEAVESILSQTYAEFRLLIIDDGSTDNSLEYVKSLSDPRIELVEQTAAKGLCRKLNYAIFHLIDSEFVATLHQDDVALPTRLEEQLSFMIQNPKYCCVFSLVSKIGAGGREFGYYRSGGKGAVEDYELDRLGCLVQSSMLVRREKFVAVGGAREECFPADDFDLLLRLWEIGPVAVINKPLIRYRIHAQAETFDSFWTMQIKTRYVKEMHRRRKNGQSEIPFNEWLKSDTPSLVRRLLRYSKGAGQLLFRKAGGLIGEHQHLRGAMYLFGAFCCYPSFVGRRLLTLRRPKAN